MFGGSPEQSPPPSTSKNAEEAPMPTATGSLEPGESLAYLSHFLLTPLSAVNAHTIRSHLGNESPSQGRSATTDNSVPSNQPGISEQNQKLSAPAQSSGAASPDPPKKHHRLLPLPSRTSLRDRPSTSDRTQDGPHDGSENTLRGSRRSLLRGRRDRSRGSSMRSREQNPGEPSLEENKTVSPDVRDPAKPEKQPKPSRKLFAFLSCCSSSDVDPEDGSIPPKKTSRRLSVAQTQPTPEKTDANAAESSTAESKPPSFFKDEKPQTTIPEKATPQPDDERIAAGAEQSSQLDGTKTSVSPDNSHTASSRDYSETSQTAGQASTQAGIVAADTTISEKSDEETGGQNLEDSTTSSHPATSEDDTKQLPPDEEAVKLPPPPPLGKQPETSIQEKSQQWLLPPALPHLSGRKCLVLDLDETLVHSSFKVLERADFTIPVEIEGQYHNIYVIKRPGVDQFMKRVGELYEVVVFTASVSKVRHCRVFEL
ncbi:hypothetical protein BDV18DRAFT_138412 [Aspergillus unguis]